MTEIKNKSIIVTGGASGIGAAAAVRAAEYGALVTVADLDDTRGAAVVATITESGGQAQFVRTDISDEDSVRALVDAAVTRFGSLHGAFNNAGVPHFSASKEGAGLLFADLTAEQFTRAIKINLIGTFLCIKYEVLAMLKTGGGSIVNTSSDAGILAVPGAPDYVSSKHGIIGLTKSAALDYATLGIRVNAVLPGIIRTPMITASFEANPEIEKWAAAAQPNKRMGDPLEVAEGALWLLSDAASLVTGVSLPVDGGFSMV